MSKHPERVAMVTGASRGIGRTIALKLANDGFAVVVNYAGSAECAASVVAEIEAAGGQARALQADISDAGAVEQLFATTMAAFGRLDVVVNNAGIMKMAPITSDNLDVLDQTLAINLRGSWLVMAKAAEVLAQGGRIIALSSSVLAKSFPGYGAYIASKAGVEGLVKVLANELRGREITVNAVAPGPVATELFFEGKSEEQVAHIAAMAPLERLGQPEEIAGTVAFLAGPDGGWVNAQILRVNGGFA
ncbi:SDR family oxidoreductase [Kushneria phyllosphaerae]|uniref:3-oxoacyl-[acyl-carrier-protein] reductase FabG n=1 Tax=Kushneria phyllosphaerae TaxID=2100822 RepID=A0A2R8CLI6_9GAMM|nr:SDR family oxidoreductase [Kushneria phyllosphaerae]SPJ33758.1 3-oxoacyl-[acyl-carrier-protein] reductase FabG [Kushneria phyllosphaerae]